ncbi:MAG: MFS transporter [Clostridia bacterium]|nr:MFS transporter [Clostridia bacterium]
MNKITDKKGVSRIALLFALTYMISYITRINYGAIISEMEKATGMSKSMLSIALTGSFITYGTGQVISGILGDKFSPKKLVTIGLLSSVCMNMLIPLCSSPYQMVVVWCINGFAQSFMWPPLVRLMTALLSPDDYKKTAAKVSYGASVGTMVMYLVSPLVISLAGWKSVFIFSALCGLVMIFIWNKTCVDIEVTSTQSKKGSINTKGLFTPLMLAIMAAIILQGMLRDGVTTWMPSYISEVYDISNLISILTGVILPIFSILCVKMATKLYVERMKNPITCAGLFFAIGMVSAVTLYLLNGTNAAFSVVLSAVLTGCMHGINNMLVSMIPPFFAKYGNVSTASGVINSCTYIGSAISTYGIAVLTENMGWNYTIGIWSIIATLGTIICFVCIRPWRKEYM